MRHSLPEFRASRRFWSVFPCTRVTQFGTSFLSHSHFVGFGCHFSGVVILVAPKRSEYFWPSQAGSEGMQDESG